MTERRLARAWPITAVVLVGVVALVLISLAHWRKGTAMLGVAAVLALILRLSLPEADLGPLAVRGRLVDSLFLAALAAGLFLLSVGFGWF